MANVEVEVHGLAELHKVMQGFAAKVEANIMRGALRAGTKVFLELARGKVPRKTGDLANSLRLRTRLRSDGKVMAWVSVGNAQAYYAHMVEFGTGSFYTGKRGRSVMGPYIIVPRGTINSRTTGKTRERLVQERLGALSLQGIVVKKIVHPGSRPKPFMRPAFDEGTPAAIAAAKGYIEKRLAKEGWIPKPEAVPDES